MPSVCLPVSKQGLKRETMVIWGFLSSITRVNLARIAKHRIPFINQAATKPAVPGEEGDGLKSAWLCFILLPSLERKQRLTVQSCWALMCHTCCAPSRLPTQQDSRSPGCLRSLDLIWGLNLCGVFPTFLDYAVLRSWQKTIFPPHREVISALSLQ